MTRQDPISRNMAPIGLREVPIALLRCRSQDADELAGAVFHGERKGMQQVASAAPGKSDGVGVQPLDGNGSKFPEHLVMPEMTLLPQPFFLSMRANARLENNTWVSGLPLSSQSLIST